MTTLEAIVRSYRAGAAERESEHHWWADQSQTLPEAIHRAALSNEKRDGKLLRHPHQYRPPAKVFPAAAARLAELQDNIASATSFDDLHALVIDACMPIRGAGELYRYDVAHRIGLYLGLRPEKVYLHRGTREGARALGIKVVGRKYIEMDELPAPLSVLTPSEAEDVLCIYKSWFGSADKVERRQRGSRCLIGSLPPSQCT